MKNMQQFDFNDLTRSRAVFKSSGSLHPPAGWGSVHPQTVHMLYIRRHKAFTRLMSMLAFCSHQMKKKRFKIRTKGQKDERDKRVEIMPQNELG